MGPVSQKATRASLIRHTLNSEPEHLLPTAGTTDFLVKLMLSDGEIIDSR